MKELNKLTKFFVDAMDENEECNGNGKDRAAGESTYSTWQNPEHVIETYVDGNSDVAADVAALSVEENAKLLQNIHAHYTYMNERVRVDEEYYPGAQVMRIGNSEIGTILNAAFAETVPPSVNSLWINWPNGGAAWTPASDVDLI